MATTPDATLGTTLMADEPARPMSNARRAWRRFFRQRLAVVGLVITGTLVFIALFAPVPGADGLRRGRSDVRESVS